VLNGKTVVDTGEESEGRRDKVRPSAIVLQGRRGPVMFRNILVKALP